MSCHAVIKANGQIYGCQREGIGAVRELVFRLPVTVAPLGLVNLF